MTRDYVVQMEKLAVFADPSILANGYLKRVRELVKKWDFSVKDVWLGDKTIKINFVSENIVWTASEDFISIEGLVYCDPYGEDITLNFTAEVKLIIGPHGLSDSATCFLSKDAYYERFYHGQL